MEIFKNPVILGLIAAVLTYGYLWWNKNESNKKRKKNKKGKKKDEGISLVLPVVVMCIVWFVSYGYFEYNNEIDIVPQTIQLGGAIGPSAGGKFKLITASSSNSDTVRSFNLINKGLTVPSKLPDVFIETFN